MCPENGATSEGLQHHGAASGKGRSHFADDLVQRPVPGGDEAADADRFLHDQRVTAVLLKGEVLEDLSGFSKMVEPDGTGQSEPEMWARPSLR